MGAERGNPSMSLSQLLLQHSALLDLLGASQSANADGARFGDFTVILAITVRRPYSNEILLESMTLRPNLDLQIFPAFSNRKENDLIDYANLLDCLEFLHIRKTSQSTVTPPCGCGFAR
jgi:hypothetical protein